MRILEGNVVAEGIKIGIVAARFNEFSVKKLWQNKHSPCFIALCNGSRGIFYLLFHYLI